MINCYKQQAPSQQQRKNSSYETLLLHVQSKFVLVRLQFFHYIAMILSKFLVVSPFLCIFVMGVTFQRKHCQVDVLHVLFCMINRERLFELNAL